MQYCRIRTIRMTFPLRYLSIDALEVLRVVLCQFRAHVNPTQEIPNKESLSPHIHARHRSPRSYREDGNKAYVSVPETPYLALHMAEIATVNVLLSNYYFELENYRRAPELEYFCTP